MIPALPTVLTVEDDPLEQAMLVESIAQDGIGAVQRVSSGEEALRLLPVVKPDIVLLDIEMVGGRLAVCRRHGGDVAVVDKPAGCGSRFMVTIQYPGSREGEKCSETISRW